MLNQLEVKQVNTEASKMKDLFGKIFKKEPQKESTFNEILAEYHPAEIDPSNLKKDTNQSEYECQATLEADEMQIDRIYQRL